VDLHDLCYALTQVVHNFGAIAVTAGAAGGRWLLPSLPPGAGRRLGWLVVSGWVAQGASGATFGAISYATFGRFPDIHGIAIGALSLKVACAIAGFAVGVLYLAREAAWVQRQRQNAWNALLAFAATAVCAAAFLRWFS
jgi:hypothetical protein